MLTNVCINVTSVKRLLCTPHVATCKAENEPFVPLCLQPTTQCTSRYHLTKWIRHHQGCLGNNKYCSFTLHQTIKDIFQWDLTLHRSTHHVTKDSAPLPCIIMNYHLNVWVGEIFQHCLPCSHLRTFQFERRAACVTSAFLYSVCFSSYTFVCPSDFAPSLFSSRFTPSALQR